MKSRYFYSAVLSSALAVGAVSCIEDNSLYGEGIIPALSVKVPVDSPEKLPVYNVNYGDELVLTPDVVYDGSENNLTYEWSVGTFDNKTKGPMEKVGTEKTLRYSFPKGGAYYAHLVVSDGTVGCVQDYEISVNRTFEQGYMIVSNDKDGKGNLVFIKDLTREEMEQGLPVTIIERCLQKVNDNIPEEKLAGSMFSSWTDWNTRKLISRLYVSSETKGMFLDPNTFTVVTEIDYSEVIPGFKGSLVFPDYTNPMVYDSTLKRYHKVNANLMFGYEDSAWANLKFEFIQPYSYGNESFDVYTVDLDPLVVYKNSPYGGLTSSATLPGADGGEMNIFPNNELLAIFSGTKVMVDHPYYGQYETNSACVISRDKSSGEVFTTLFTGMDGGYTMGMELVNHAKSETTAQTALPHKDISPVMSSLYNRVYFTEGNRVYVMLREGMVYTFPDKNQYCIELPSDEEITCLWMDQHLTGSETLVIATVNRQSGRGSVYFYDPKDVRTDNPDPDPKARYKDCAGRISSVTYKPRIS